MVVGSVVVSIVTEKNIPALPHSFVTQILEIHKGNSILRNITEMYSSIATALLKTADGEL